jgi:gliding motility-associated-like protein
MAKRFQNSFFLWLLLVACSQLTYSQLSNFVLTVTPTNETCTANGALSFSVSNTTAGSAIVYAIYKLPNLSTPLSTTSTTSYNGLTSGTYLVIATQTLGSQSGTQQQQVLIEDQRVLLTYQITGIEVVCPNDGVLTVTTLTGVAATYSIIGGPVTRPPQPSNTFTNLPAGQYTIRVIDSCGEGVVQTYTLTAKNPALTFTNPTASLTGCNSVSLGFGFTTTVPAPMGVVKFPLQVVTTINPPSGSPIITNSTLTSGSTFSTVAPLFTPQPYSYSFVITDGCGTTYTLNGQVNNISGSAVSYALLNVSCSTKKIKFSALSGLILTSAPVTYPNPLPQDFTSQIVNHEVTTLPLGVGFYTFQATNLCGQVQTLIIEITAETPNQAYDFAYGITCVGGNLAFYFVSQIVMVAAPAAYSNPLPFDFTATINANNATVLLNLPPGTYTFNALDLCGNPVILHGTIAPVAPQPSYTVYPDCDGTNTSTLKIDGVSALTITTAPPGYAGSLPQVLTSLISSNTVMLSGLPVGNYTFIATNTCNNVGTLLVTVPLQTETTTVNSVQNCGSFNLDLHHTSTNTAVCTFWLQKYYPANSDWGHPGTGVLQGINLPSANNAYELLNNTLNLNLAYTGQFRVVKVQPVYVSPGNTLGFCYKVINEFQTNGQPVILSVNSISCNNTYDVVVNAIGFGPLTYKITTKNGLPFVINNSTSNLFTGLAPAIYTFQVTDFCGNIVNSVYEINVPNPLTITEANLCPNQTATLSVPNYGFLSYQWWKNTNPSVILSTTNILTLANFNPATQSGTYTVSIVYAGNPTSCLNTTLTFTINAANYSPHAGGDKNVSYCGEQGTLNLNTFLNGTYDSGGTWQVTSNNTTINGADWISNAVTATTVYQFKYTVLAPAGCNVKDEAIVTITIKEVPQNPTATVDPVLCEGENIALYASTISNVTYQWSGPNGFTSTTQNPIIPNGSTSDNGLYSVKVTKASCTSQEGTVTVLVSPKPKVALEGKCDQNRFVITALPVDNSFDPSDVSYSWTGPAGYTNDVNPIDITQLPIGTYAVRVTNALGCFNEESLAVSFTFCEVPNVITPNGDSANEYFELSGLEVELLEIYNRWGKKVYEKEGYTNEWHGQNQNGNQLPDGTYYYYIKRQNEAVKIGWILLLRG